MLGFRGSGIGYAAASWQWQPSPHDPANVLELSDVAVAGSYTLTANSGAVTLTGSNATLKVSRTLVANSAAIALSGTTATLRLSKTLTAQSGAVTLAGQQATLRTARSLTANSGSVTLAGTQANIRLARLLAGNSGTVTLAGQTATLTYTPLAASNVLTCEPGEIALSGSSAELSVTGSAPRTNQFFKGDDVGGVASSTNTARNAIYERQIRQIEERIAQQPVPKTAKKRKRKIAAIETELQLLAQQPLPEVYRLESILGRVDTYEGSEADYSAILASLQAYFEQVKAFQRKQRHKRIAIAMLMAA